MHAIKTLLILLMLAPVAAYGQTATIVRLPSGQMIGLVQMPSGEAIVVPTVILIELEPPAPLVKTSAVIFESEDQTQKHAMLTNEIRDNPQVSRAIGPILDQDTQDEDGNPDPLVRSAMQRIGDKALPRVVGFSADGSAVDDRPLPASLDGVVEVLKEWGRL